MNEQISNILNGLAETGALQEKIIKTVVIIVIAVVLKHLLSKLINKNVSDHKKHFYGQQTLKYFIFGISFILIGRVWFIGVGSIATFLGLIGAGLVIALNDVVKNILGFFVIMWQRPLSMGDRVEIGDKVGDVVDIKLFHILLMETNGPLVNAFQSSGRVLHIPCSFIFTKTINNFNKGFPYIWAEIPVMVTFESNWRKMKAKLLELGQQNTIEITEAVKQEFRDSSKNLLIRLTYFDPIVYTSVADSGITLTVRFLINPRKMRGVEENIWEGLLDYIAESNDLDLAYPTYRTYLNTLEGKPGLKPQNSSPLGL